MEIVIQENSQYGLVVSSRTVAKELGKRHDAVLRDIKNILKNQSPQICGDLEKLIIPSTYIDSKKRNYKEYLLTKDGFTLYMFNIQGYQDFKIAYIQKFNEMEKMLNQQLVQGENTLLLKEIERLREIEKKYNNVPISWAGLECIKEQINMTVTRRCECLDIPNKFFKKYLLMELKKEISEKFGIEELTELREKDYQVIMPYILYWIESYSLRSRYIP